MYDHQVVASPSTTSPEDFLRVVGEPQRWRLLQHLVESDLKVSELVQRTGRAQNLVSYHLGELRSVGLVSSRRSSADGRDAYYRVHLDRYGELMGSTAAALVPTLEVRAASPPPMAALRRRRLRVLFLCTGNSARSQMAEALLVHRSDGAVRASSAGSHPKPLHPNAVRAMAARGIDISGSTTRHLDDVAGIRFHRVVTLCDKVKEVCPELPGDVRTSHWSMADPSAGGGSAEATYPAFTAAADEIDDRVGLLLSQLHPPTEDSNAT